MFNDAVIEAVRESANAELDLSHVGLGEHRLGDVASRQAVVAALLPKVKMLPPARRAEVTDAIVEACGVTLRANLMMTREQLARLADAGMDIGGHTCSHPILCSVDDDAARREIVCGKREIEAITGRPVHLFAYPNGRPAALNSDDLGLTAEDWESVRVNDIDL